jgi:predicted nucleotidyltransferase
MTQSASQTLVTELHGIRFDVPLVVGLLRRHYVTRLQVYGSILREDFHADSDLDMLVGFDPDHFPVGWAMFELEAELAVVLGRPVELGLPTDLSKYIRGRVLAEAKTVYVH